MPRPTGKTCTRCVRNLTICEDHLGNTYDRYFLRNPEATEQDLIEYALNRMLALDRDNGNKAEGLPASRNYQSRNERSARALANRCGYPGARGLKCIRTPHPDEPDRHKF